MKGVDWSSAAEFLEKTRGGERWNCKRLAEGGERWHGGRGLVGSLWGGVGDDPAKKRN